MTFNPNIPQPNDLISASQAQIQTNFSQADTAFGIDHTPFSTLANQGQHKKVTFSGNNVPAVFPVNPPVLFTDTITGANRGLFFYSGSAAQSSTQYVLSGNGSVLLMGGIIMKWGTFTTNATSMVVPFASAFPNNKFSVVVSATSGNANDVISVQVDGNLNQFTALRAITTNLPYYYIAIGN
jgi:hypothetical protein